VPESLRPAYAKPNEHLKGSDAEIVERVKAEVWKVHGDALTQLGIDLKNLTIEGRRA
jgi:hypothetical protein